MPKQKRTLSDFVSSCQGTGSVLAYRLKLGDGAKEMEAVALVAVGKAFKADKDIRPIFVDPAETDIAETIEEAATDAGWGTELRTLRVDALDEHGKHVTSWSLSVALDEDADDANPKGKKDKEASNRWDYGQRAVQSSNEALIRMLDAGTRHADSQSKLIEKMAEQYGRALEKVMDATDHVSDAREAAFGAMVQSTIDQMKSEAESDPAMEGAWGMFQQFFGKVFGNGVPGTGFPGMPQTPKEWAEWARKNAKTVREVLSSPEVMAAVQEAGATPP